MTNLERQEIQLAEVRKISREIQAFAHENRSVGLELDANRYHLFNIKLKGYTLLTQYYTGTYYQDTDYLLFHIVKGYFDDTNKTSFGLYNIEPIEKKIYWGRFEDENLAWIDEDGIRLYSAELTRHWIIKFISFVDDIHTIRS